MSRKEKTKREEFGVSFDGSKFVLPQALDFDGAIAYLEKARDQAMQTVEIAENFAAFPLDAAVALYEALKAVYGFVQTKGRPSFFGEQPPVLQTVSTPSGDRQFIMGRIAPPAWDGGFIELSPTGPLSVRVEGTIRRKSENEVLQVIRLIKEHCRINSIYRGNAILLDGEKLTRSRHDVLRDGPAFMHLGALPELILNPDEQALLNAHLWGVIRNAQALRAQGLPLKQGLLLAGPYGTGKTLTATHTAQIACDHGWSFIYLKQAAYAAEALKVAQMLEPSVLFIEDIDTETSGERDASLNSIMNTLDGVDSKGAEVITVFTTNRLEKIHPGVLRAGRIDSIIELGLPGAEAAMQFIRAIGGRYMIEPGNAKVWEPAAQALAGLPCAFIAEAIHKAIRATIALHGIEQIRLSPDLVTAQARSIARHVELAKDRPAMSQAEQTVQNLQGILALAMDPYKIAQGVDESTTYRRVDEIHDATC